MDAASERNDAKAPMPMLHSDDGNGSTITRTTSAPMSLEYHVPETQMSGPLYANSNQEFVFQPPQKTNLETYPSSIHDSTGKIGQQGICNHPHCTTCPMHSNVKGPSTTSHTFDAKNMLHGDPKVWAKRLWSHLLHYIPGVMNPHAKILQNWNKFFIISCSFAILLDPFFFFLLYVQENNKCIILNWSMATILIVLRSMNDFIYLLHILLQFRLAYVAPGSIVGGRAELIDDPKRIARNYLSRLFIIDFFAVLPLSQIVVLLILRYPIGSGAIHAKNLLRLAILVQLVPRIHRILPLVVGSSPSSFVFVSAWSNVIMNLLTFVLASHVVGSCWYLFSLQRVHQCFQDACRDSNITRCMHFINCGHGNEYVTDVEAWKNNENAIACFGKDAFDFGIFQTAVNLTTQKSIATRYVYSLFWGFQQISTLAGNQVPSYFMWEVVFTMAITGVGLLLFALLIGNVQNFLQALGRRRVEMYVRSRDVEQWMSHHRLPEELQSKVRNCERFNNWATTSVVNEKDLMENLPEDLQQQIRRHLFKYVERVHIFQLLDEPIVDALRERLKMKTYLQGSQILYHGGLIDKMVFIIRGKLESTGEYGISFPLSEGDVCGEELITWSLEHSSVNKDGTRIRIPGHKSLSNRVVSCLTYVEAFVLRASDLEEVTSLFARFLKSPRVQGAIRYESPYWRGLAAKCIQDAWRCRKKRIKRADSSSPPRI
ncbi:hypothetical protein ACS0TY_007251 [Phlomoides rotata]